MKFTNRQFGELEFDDQHVVTLANGLIGFEQHRRFLIVDDADSEPFRWLVSIEDTDLSFPLLDPRLLVPEYLTRSGVGEGSSVFVIAALSDRLEQSSINLRSPLVIDNATQKGQQLILDDESLPFQFPLVAATSTVGSR